MKISFHSIKTKLLLLLFIPLVLFAVASLYLLSTLSSTVDRLSDRLYEKGSIITQLMLNADRDLYQALTAYMSITLRESDAASREAALASYQENLQQTKDQIITAKGLIEQGGLQEMTHAVSGKTVSELLREIESGLASWENLTAAVLQDPSANMTQSEIDAAFDTTRGYIDQIQEIMEEYQQQAIREEKDSVTGTAMAMYISLAIEWSVLILAGLWVIRQISRTIDRVRRKTQRVSEGYLDLPEMTRYPKDELGQIQKDVDDMILRMRELIGEILNSSQAVSAATGELAASAHESTAASTHVAENIQEVTRLVEVQSTTTSESSKAIGEMTIGVQRIAESTGTIAVHARDTNEQSEQGNELLMKLKEQMEIIVGEISRLADTVALLNEKSAEIGAITENITAFANQTGILSLNASIEAARAGEHGRGFAVVADEIRKLAANSLESAKNINELVSDTRHEISNAGAHMQTTITQVERGSTLMQEVAEGFQAITASIREVSEQIQEMSAVTEQMSASSQQVSASMEQTAASIREVSGKAENVASATEEQLALVENIARSADQLRGVVDNLNKAVGYFKI